MVTYNKLTFTNMLPIMPINPLMMALKTTTASGSLTNTTLTSSMLPLTRIDEETTKEKLKEHSVIKPRLTFSIDSLVGSKTTSKISKNLPKNEYLKNSTEYVQAIRSRSSSPTVSNYETNDDVNVTSSRSSSPATVASSQQDQSHNLSYNNIGSVRPFPLHASALINSNLNSCRNPANSSCSSSLKSNLPTITQSEHKPTAESLLQPIQDNSGGQNHLLAAQFQMAVLAHHHHNHNHLIPQQQQQHQQQPLAPSIPLPPLGLPNGTASHLPPGYPFGFLPHHQIPPAGPVYVGSTPLVRDTYPLYPWLLSRHGRIFSHRFPGFLLQPFRKPKRVRTAFSPTQLLKLEHAFEENHYVVGAERKLLAQGLSLTETQVKVWFQNRRTKHKRLQQESDSDSKSQRGSDGGGDNETYKHRDLHHTEDSQQSYEDSNEQTNVALDRHNSFMLQDIVNPTHSQDEDDEDEVIDINDYENSLEGLTCNNSNNNNNRLHHVPILEMQEISSQYRQQAHQHFLSTNPLILTHNQHQSSHLYLDQRSFANIPSLLTNAKFSLQNPILSPTEVHQS